LEDRPEAFDRVGVDRDDDVLSLGVVNHGILDVAAYEGFVNLDDAAQLLDVLLKAVRILSRQIAGRQLLPGPAASGSNCQSSFDFAITRAPCRISKCSSGKTNSAFSKAALQMAKLLTWAISSSPFAYVLTILKVSSSIKRIEQTRNAKSRPPGRALRFLSPGVQIERMVVS
ncbi:MAG: hypothetical protein ACLPKB_29185, partial [Xanthobacteraceae bacterium]